MRAYMCILVCADGSYYVGSTNNLELRVLQHQNGEGANHTKHRLPVKLVYYEEYERIDLAFIEKSRFRAGIERKRRRSLKELRNYYRSWQLPTEIYPDANWYSFRVITPTTAFESLRQRNT